MQQQQYQPMPSPQGGYYQQQQPGQYQQYQQQPQYAQQGQVVVQMGPGGQPQQVYAQTPQGQVVVQMQPGMQMQPQMQVQMQPQQMQMQPQQMQMQAAPQMQMQAAPQQTAQAPGVPAEYASQVPPMTATAAAPEAPKSKTIGGGIITSNDAKLSNDEKALGAFFSNNLTRPRVLINVEGYRWETKTVHRREPNGEMRTHTERVKEIDFKYDIDITSYVTEIAQIDEKTNEVIIKFAQSKKHLKRISMYKKIGCDFNKISSAIKSRCQQLGYRHGVDVRLVESNPEVRVDNSTDVSKCLRSTCCDIICILTCTWVIGYPVKKMMEEWVKFNVTYKLGYPEEMVVYSIYPLIQVRNPY